MTSFGKLKFSSNQKNCCLHFDISEINNFSHNQLYQHEVNVGPEECGEKDANNEYKQIATKLFQRHSHCNSMLNILNLMLSSLQNCREGSLVSSSLSDEIK